MNYKDLTHQYNQAQWDAAENDAETIQMLDKLCMQMFGKRFNQLSPARKQQARTLAATTKSVLYGLTGADPMRDASMFTSIHQGLMNSGPINVGGFGSSYYGQAYGAGNISMAVAGQLADQFGGAGARNYGMDKQLLGGLIGNIVARNGVGDGVRHINLGTTSGSAFKALDEARKNGVDITKGEGRKLLTAAAAMDRLDYVAAMQTRLKELQRENPDGDYAEQVKEAERLAKEDVIESKKDGKSIFATRNRADRDAAVRMMKTMKSARTTTIDGESVELSTSDIEFAVNAFDGKGMGEVVTKGLSSDIDKAIQAVKENVKDLSGLFGTNDFQQLQQYASDLHLGALSDAKNVKQVKEWVHQTQTIAYGTGRDIGQVIKDQLAIAEALGPNANTNIIVGTQRAQAAFQAEEQSNDSAGGPKVYSTAERMGMYTQGLQNMNNFSGGLYAARYLKESGTLTSEQNSRLDELIAEMQSADSEKGWHDANEKLRQYIASDLGAAALVNDPKMQEVLAGKYSTTEDRNLWDSKHAKGWGKKWAKGALASKSNGQRLRDAGWTQETLAESLADLGTTLGADKGKFNKVLEFAGKDATDEEMAGAGLNKVDIEYVKRLRSLSAEQRETLAAAAVAQGVQDNPEFVNANVSRSSQEAARVQAKHAWLKRTADSMEGQAGAKPDAPAISNLIKGYINADGSGDRTAENMFSYLKAESFHGKNPGSQEEFEEALAKTNGRFGNKEVAELIRSNPGKYTFYQNGVFVRGEDGSEQFSEEMRKKMAAAAGISEDKLSGMEDWELQDAFEAATGLSLKFNRDDNTGETSAFAISDDIQQKMSSDYMTKLREGKNKKLFEGLSDKTISENFQLDEDQNIVAVRKTDSRGHSTWIGASNAGKKGNRVYGKWYGDLGDVEDEDERRELVEASGRNLEFKDGVLDPNSEAAKIFVRKYMKYQENKNSSQLAQAAAGPGLQLDDDTKNAISDMKKSLASIDTKIQAR